MTSQPPSDAGSAVPAPPSPWNLPNALTVLRILMVPIYGWLLLTDEGNDVDMRWWACGVFVLAMITDRLDGDIARARGLVTDFGKLADPIADKALTGMGFIGLSLIGDLWWWVTFLVLFREIGITVLRLVIIRYGVMPASRGGKLKTTLQAVALGLMTAPLGGLWETSAIVVMAAAVAVTLATGVDYVLKARAMVVAGRS
ncbi:CDP-diacylglycerol--glycerol-3-phosphate 3-phosphatidyltransferase [Austwickia sp. TVS 96-490-7B]|uniref:CDP-diacylglycerol--glycerol-3-phosphate 3-phosphatidyltransferase n=1 Tax=Austwickia sp. TVS 96-490-7B TaxID=2830843 RepID=UPI001C582854|nr:CDP-diacylglycerol--glycerol-3-phosphate 3-phosphatidyltransferase [Austwickia sp. TVS 96-490-7B]MBW3086485.1 CDP-diacylglycerol--glycerol-3-phosphate 3-phosphatidyltransferase [Austwickia sp. TVS 96-490-7B]